MSVIGFASCLVALAIAERVVEQIADQAGNRTAICLGLALEAGDGARV